MGCKEVEARHHSEGCTGDVIKAKFAKKIICNIFSPLRRDFLRWRKSRKLLYWWLTKKTLKNLLRHLQISLLHVKLSTPQKTLRFAVCDNCKKVFLSFTWNTAICNPFFYVYLFLGLDITMHKRLIIGKRNSERQENRFLRNCKVGEVEAGDRGFQCLQFTVGSNFSRIWNHGGRRIRLKSKSLLNLFESFIKSLKCFNLADSSIWSCYFGSIKRIFLAWFTIPESY